MTEEKQQNQDRPLAFTAAQRFFCAWLIRLRAAADILRALPAGLPGLLPRRVPPCRAAIALSNRSRSNSKASMMAAVFTGSSSGAGRIVP
jgi:hypothetical protein